MGARLPAKVRYLPTYDSCEGNCLCEPVRQRAYAPEPHRKTKPGYDATMPERK